MQRLKHLRISRKMSQQQLAAALGASQQSINSYENGRHEPDIEMLKQMARFFGTSIDYLVGYVDEETPITEMEEYQLTREEAGLLRRFRRMPQRIRDQVSGLMEAFVMELEAR